MTASNAHLVGQIALAEGLVTPERLEECVKLQGKSGDGRNLGQILVEKGYLSREQLERLISLQKTRFETISSDPARGGLFGQIAVRQGYVSQANLAECLREQAGSSLMLGQVLMKKGYLTVENFLEILRRQKKDVRRCPGCDAFYDVKGIVDSQKFVCTNCGTVVR